MANIADISIASGGAATTITSGLTEGALYVLLHDGPIQVEMLRASGEWMVVYTSKLADQKEFRLSGTQLRISNPAARELKGKVSSAE